jgi:transposase
MRHVGLDVHQLRTQACVIDDETGEILDNQSLLTAQVCDFLRDLGPEELQVVLESGGLSWFVALHLQSLGVPVIVVDAHKAHPYLEREATAKTDAHDARGLARLSYEGKCQRMQVWLPDEATLVLRRCTRLREDFVSARTRAINQLRGELRGLGLYCEASDMSSLKARDWWEQTRPLLPPGVARVLDQRWSALWDLDKKLREVEQQLAELIQEDPVCQQLDSIPGCGLVLIATIRAEVGDIRRFEQPEQLRSYAGLTPQVHQSGEKRRTGPLEKRHDPHLRRAMLLLAQQVTRSTAWKGTRLVQRYWQHYRRLGPNVARVALARRLCDLIHVILTRGEDLDLKRWAA